MNKNLIITIRTQVEAKVIESIGCQIIAHYSTYLLVRCNEDQYQDLLKRQIKAKELI